ncbi:TonB-dependent receptor [Marinilabiliaceae bacterium JC017]|nr:TonB-dependent receptor [Marinilabiliaceae bacterium JC017]
MKRTILTLTLFVALLYNGFSQQITQTVRGTVTDAVTQESLVGATIIVLDSAPTIGTICDMNGAFILENVPIGRQSLKISMVGYESYIVSELMISTGKETVLDIALQTSDIGLEEVVVTVHKDAPLNTMSSLSARQFSVEETQRYAGGMDDPARLASSFAGVATPSISSNGISVRGNNPQGLLWRIEGIEVPNPNHFANLTVAGGGMLTVISNHIMGNSDFYTGAFPAEYGNASSGVFDIKMKTGNTSKREYTFQAGAMGIDFASEGPFKKGQNASYLVNYRYSTMGLIAPLLPDDAGIMKYQDLAFKTNFPTSKAGTFSLWGIGAQDGITMTALDSAEWKADADRDNADDQLYMFATGLSHKIQVGEKTFLNTTLSTSGTGLSHVENRLDYNLQQHPQTNVKNNTWRYCFQSVINRRFSTKHTNRTGFSYSHLGYNINIEEAVTDGTPLVPTAKGQGQSGFLQLFTQSRFNPIPQLTLNLGVHYQHNMLNNNYSIEPRAGVKYDINPKHSIAFAYGLHSRLEILPVYFVDIDGTKPNKDLDFMKSNHFVLSYNVKLNNHLRLSIEPYYQHLVNVPVSPTSYISTVNIENDIFFNEALVNNGTGRNIGIDLTLERFLKNGLYYLATASVFDSKYTGADRKERNTRFNKNYVFNALIGKEWMVGRKNHNILGANIRLNYMGGNRIEHVDETASLAAKEVIYGETNGNVAYSKQFDDIPIFSFTLSFRRNKPKYSSVWSLQVINATKTEEFSYDYYNLKTNTINQKYNSVMIPNISYKIEF